MKSYRPEELFDAARPAAAGVGGVGPRGRRRMGANPHANGGLLLRELRMPDFRQLRGRRARAGAVQAEATRVQGQLIRDVMKLNAESRNFRVFSPDETNSNRWQAVFEDTNRQFVAEILPGDDHVALSGRVMEMLSEHQCQGWLEGYLPDRPARLLLLLRGVHSHRRFDVQPARQVAEDDPRASPGGGRSPR